MNRYDIGWRDSLRMKAGLYWQKDRPTWEDIADTAFDVLFFAVIVIAFVLLFGWLDARDARITAEIEATESAQQFAQFLNGGILTNPEQTFAAKCGELITVTMETHK
jgi:hypothetical protein